jgi:hypothetical protein
MSICDRGTEDKPKWSDGRRRNLLWEDEFEYFGHTGAPLPYARAVRAASEPCGGKRTMREGTSATAWPVSDAPAPADLTRRDARRSEQCRSSARPTPAQHRSRLAARRAQRNVVAAAVPAQRVGWRRVGCLWHSCETAGGRSSPRRTRTRPVRCCGSIGMAHCDVVCRRPVYLHRRQRFPTMRALCCEPRRC